MKVLRLCQYFYSKEKLESGLMPHFYNLVIKLEELGIKNTIITPQTDSKKVNETGGLLMRIGSSSQTESDVKVYLIPTRKRFTIIRAGIDSYKKIKNLIGDARYDFIHTHNYGFFYLYHFKKKFSIPFIHQIHGTIFPYKYQPFLQSLNKETIYNYFFNKYAIKKADAIITGSSDEKELITKNLGIEDWKVNFIHSAVDIKTFKVLKSEKPIDILYVGRFVKKKGIPILLNSIKKLKKRNLKVLLIGGYRTDSDYNNVINTVRKLGLSENVEIKNTIPHAEMIKYYNLSKIFILPSFHEAVPKVILEAMACGLPVIATNVCGHKDAIIDNVTGFLIPPKNSQILADKIDEIIDNDNLRRRMGLEGRKRIDKYFTWDIVAKKHAELYKKVKGVKG